MSRTEQAHQGVDPKRIMRVAPLALGKGSPTSPDLPPPDAGSWTIDEVRLSGNAVRSLKKAGVVEEFSREPNDVGPPTIRYRTIATAWQTLQSRWANTLPCGHGGFRRLRPEEASGELRFTCSCADCGRRYRRERVLEVFGGE